jgi:hypothetical protein
VALALDAAEGSGEATGLIKPLEGEPDGDSLAVRSPDPPFV